MNSKKDSRLYNTDGNNHPILMSILSEVFSFKVPKVLTMPTKLFSLFRLRTVTTVVI